MAVTIPPFERKDSFYSCWMSLNSNKQSVSIQSIREYYLIATPGTHQEKDLAINEICSTQLPGTEASWHRLGGKQGF